jgi:DNA excision repair protein ERCC-5
LTRDKLIYLALFLGSDYTLGIKGIGVVNGMEIINTFDDYPSLLRFKDWAMQDDKFL